MKVTVVGGCVRWQGIHSHTRNKDMHTQKITLTRNDSKNGKRFPNFALITDQKREHNQFHSRTKPQTTNNEQIRRKHNQFHTRYFPKTLRVVGELHEKENTSSIRVSYNKQQPVAFAYRSCHTDNSPQSCPIRSRV